MSVPLMSSNHLGSSVGHRVGQGSDGLLRNRIPLLLDLFLQLHYGFFDRSFDNTPLNRPPQALGRGLRWPG